MLSQMAKKPEITDSGKSSSKGDGSTFNFQGPNVNYFDLNRSKNADRDPDGLYQLGRKVGVVENVSVDLANGKITFGIIRGAMDLDSSRELLYRNYILKLEAPGAEAGQREGPQGRWIERRVMQVVGRIVQTER